MVPEQELPDGNFSTVEYPNPEDGKAFALALKLARKKDADVVLATDPDADRLGIYAKDAQTGEYLAFTGNMSGLLIADYRLSQLQERGELPQNPADGALVTTVVSSNMAFEVAKAYGLSVIEVLTGFKFIGEQIKLFEDAKYMTIDYRSGVIHLAEAAKSSPDFGALEGKTIHKAYIQNERRHYLEWHNQRFLSHK